VWQGSYKAIKYTKDVAMLDAFNDRYQARWHERSGATNEVADYAIANPRYELTLGTQP